MNEQNNEQNQVQLDPLAESQKVRAELYSLIREKERHDLTVAQLEKEITFREGLLMYLQQKAAASQHGQDESHDQLTP